MNDLSTQETVIAGELHCPRAPICVWDAYMHSSEREHAIRADEAMRWERRFQRAEARVRVLEAQIAQLKRRTA